MTSLILLLLTFGCVVNFAILAFRFWWWKRWIAVTFLFIALGFGWLLFGDIVALVFEHYVYVLWPTRPMIFRAICFVGSIVALGATRPCRM